MNWYRKATQKYRRKIQTHDGWVFYEVFENGQWDWVDDLDPDKRDIGLGYALEDLVLGEDYWLLEDNRIDEEAKPFVPLEDAPDRGFKLQDYVDYGKDLEAPKKPVDSPRRPRTKDNWWGKGRV
jgi:hypothetical protein